MGEVLTALVTMGVVVAVGWLLGHRKVFGPDASRAIATVAFTVAIPALLVDTLARADLGVLLSRYSLVLVVGTLLVALIAAVLFRWSLRRPPGVVAIGMFSSSYANAVVLGLPLSVYLLGGPLPAVPLVLIQLLVIAPLTLMMLDAAGQGPRERAGMLTGLLANPVLLGTLVGLAAGLAPFNLPAQVLAPFAMVGAAAAPLALILLGMSLSAVRIAGGDSRRAFAADLAVVVAIRSVVHPVLAFGLAQLVGLGQAETMAVVVMAALPTAQNAIVYARRYGHGVELAGAATVVTSLLTLPVLLIATALLS